MAHPLELADVITDPDQVTPEWLTRALLEWGHLYVGQVVRVSRIAAEVMPRSSGTRLQVAYSSDALPQEAPRRLYLKLSLQPEFEMGSREVEFYRVVAPAMQAGILYEQLPFVRCYHAAYSPESEVPAGSRGEVPAGSRGSRYHALLEDLSETHSATDRTLPPTQVETGQMVDALARIHAFWWEHPRLGDDVGQRPTPESIGDLMASAATTLPAFLDFCGDRLPSARRRTLEAICLGGWPARRVERLLSGRGITIVNRDIHPGNILYPRDPVRDRVRVADWESWRVDAGTDDLAYLMAAHWYPERRARLERRLLERYLERLHLYGIAGYDQDACWYDYRASIIRVLFFLVGGWRPGRAPALYWDRMERALMAYEDLGCRELLPIH